MGFRNESSSNLMGSGYRGQRNHWLSNRMWEGKKGIRQTKRRMSAFLCASSAGKCGAMLTAYRQGEETGHTGVFPPGNSLSLQHCFPVWRVMNTTVDPICFFSSVEPTLCCQPVDLSILQGVLRNTDVVTAFRFFV